MMQEVQVILFPLALIWNPTLAMTHKDGLYNQANPSGQVNPLALSMPTMIIECSTILANFSAGFKITPELEYKITLWY